MAAIYTPSDMEAFFWLSGVIMDHLEGDHSWKRTTAMEGIFYVLHGDDA